MKDFGWENGAFAFNTVTFGLKFFDRKKTSLIAMRQVWAQQYLLLQLLAPALWCDCR